MNQWKSLLNNLSLKQKLAIVAVALVVAGGLFSLVRWNRERDFKPLYANLASEDAGAVIAKLKESGTDYRVSDAGDTVLAPSSKVAELRLQLAAAGLPKSGRIGYELFDKNNFGATDFTEQVNFHRALEGELERSIMALNEIERARVHLTFAKDSLFAEQRQPAKASVMIKLKSGRQLSPPNVLAITHLVASAVEGLLPESVSVVDMAGNLLNRPRRVSSTDSLEGTDSALEFRQKIEKDLLAKINSTLEPVVGVEKYRAGVSVECDFTSGEQSEETFDPNRSVMVTSQKTEDQATSGGSGGLPGTASNLPRAAGRGGSGYGNTRRTESISYQTSRTVKRVRIPQGTIRRVSVAILLDQAVRWEGTGSKARRVLEPPSADRIKIIHDLVAGATGLQTDRGDQLTVETLPFEATLQAAPPGEPQSQMAPPSGFHLPPVDFKNPQFLMVVGGAGLGLVLCLGLVALLVFKRRKPKQARATAAAGGTKEIPAASSDVTEALQQKLEHRFAEQDAERQLQAQELLASLKLPAVKTTKTEVLSKQIVDDARKDPQAMAHVMRAWLTERSDDR